MEKHIAKAKEKQKQQYDKKVRGVQLQIGDKVLVKILAHKEGKHKLADKYEENIYTVIEQPRDDIPVFRVRSQTGDEKILHRNHLFPVSNQDIKEDEIEAEKEKNSLVDQIEVRSERNQLVMSRKRTLIVILTTSLFQKQW